MSHLNSAQFDEDRGKFFERIKDELDFVVNIAYDLESSKISVDYANKYDFIYATVGFSQMKLKGIVTKLKVN